MRPPTDTGTAVRKFYVLKFKMCWIFLRYKFLKKILTSKNLDPDLSESPDPGSVNQDPKHGYEQNESFLLFFY